MESRSWSTASAIKFGIATLCRHPLKNVLFLGVVPALWDLPLELIRRHLLPTSPSAQLDVWYFAEQVYWFSWCIWSAVPFAGCIAISLGTARDQRPSYRHFLTTMRTLASLAGLQLVLFALPLLLLTLPVGGALSPIVGWVQFGLGLLWAYLLVRVLYSLILAVDQRLPVLVALRDSWVLTRGSVLRLFTLVLFALFLGIPAMIWGKDSLLITELVSIATAPPIFLAFAKAYVSIRSED